MGADQSHQVMSAGVLINDPVIEALRNALRSSITLSEIVIDESTCERVAQLSESLIESDKRSGRCRDEVEIINSVIKGTYTEIAVYVLLDRAGLRPTWNVITDPRATRRTLFNYDITCLGKRIEIKSQSSYYPRTCFSYKRGDGSEYKRVQNFWENWYDYDLLIAVQTDYTLSSLNATFTPWQIISNHAFDPALRLFTSKGQYGYWYLKTDICVGKGLLIQI